MAETETSFSSTSSQKKSTEDVRKKEKEPSSERRSRHKKQLVMFLTATAGYLNIGMAFSWPNTLVSDIQDDSSTIFGNQLQLSDWEMDMTSSIIFAGAVAGIAISGWIVARLGRHRSMMLTALPGILGWAIVFLALNPFMIFIGRFINGIAVALLGVSVRTYLVEISDTSIRGAASLTADIMKNTGAIVIIVLGMIIPWNYLALICACHTLLYVLLIAYFLPESPTYLIVRGREEEAHKVLLRLRGSYADIDEEIKEIKERNKGVDRASGWGVLLQPDIFKKFLIIVGLFAISNFCGSEVIRSNAFRMLQTSGLLLDTDLSTIFVFVLLLGGVFIQILLTDAIGRKKCLILSLIILMVSYGILGTHVFLDSFIINIRPLNPEGNLTTSERNISLSSGVIWSWVPTSCLMMAAFSVTLGIGPIPWIISAEYFPTNIRSQVMSACGFAAHLLSFGTQQIYSPMQEVLTPAGRYWSYSCFALIGIAYTKFLVTETKGRKIG